MSILRTSNKTWTYDFRYKCKRYRARFKSRDKAIKAEAKKRLELGKKPNLCKPITFREAAQLFLDKHAKPNKKTWKTDEEQIDCLNELFGDKKLTDFTSLDIQNMCNFVQKRGIKSSTIDRYHAMVKTIFNKMIIWRKFEGFNPANGVKLKNEPNAHIRFLSKDEIRLLEKHIKDDIVYPYYVCALHTGMRRGEICAMQWEHITFPIRDVFVPKSKSGKPRHIPLNDTIFSYLRDLYSTRKNREGFIFGEFSADYITHRFNRTCKQIGIKDFRFHDLRHTFASYLVMSGVNIFQVSKWLGHASVTTTEKYYAHLARDTRRDEINNLNRLFSNSESLKVKRNEIDVLTNDNRIDQLTGISKPEVHSSLSTFLSNF